LDKVWQGFGLSSLKQEFFFNFYPNKLFKEEKWI